MHRGMYWWRHTSPAGLGPWFGCGPSVDVKRWEPSYTRAAHEGYGGAFGVRRPLRFLAYKLGLTEEQLSGLAAILSELKTERAQADVDRQRTSAAFADVLAAETYDEAKATEAAALRMKSAEQMRVATLKALGRLHALLDAEQRHKLAYLIRTGRVSL